MPVPGCQDDNVALTVAVFKAEGIQNTQMFSDQDPYVKVYLRRTAVAIEADSGSGGEDEDVKSLRSATAESGGIDPEWDDGLNEIVTNKLLFWNSSQAEAIVFEVWSENTMVDDLVGRAEIPLPLVPERTPEDGRIRPSSSSAKLWVDLDTGGRLEYAAYLTPAVTTANVKIGTTVVRGPHWTEGDYHDKHGKGLIIGFQKEGVQFGVPPITMNKEEYEGRTLVLWDNTKLKGVYAMGTATLVYPTDGSDSYKYVRYDLEYVGQDEPASETATSDSAVAAVAGEGDLKQKAKKKKTPASAAEDGGDGDGDGMHRVRMEMLRMERARAQHHQKPVTQRKPSYAASAVPSSVSATSPTKRIRAKDSPMLIAQGQALARAAQISSNASAVAESVAAQALQAYSEVSDRDKVARGLQNWCRGWLARKVWPVAVFRLAAARVQATMRGRLVRNRRKKLADLARHVQRHLRGGRFLKLARAAASGALCVDVLQGVGLRATGLFQGYSGSRSLYTKVILLPSRTEMRTRWGRNSQDRSNISDGSWGVTWNRSHENRLVFALHGLHARSMRVEVHMRSNFGGKDDLVGSAEMSIPLHLGQGENSEGHWVDLRSHAPAAKILLRSFLIEPARLQNQDDEEAKPAAPTIDTTPAPHGGGRRKFSVMDSPNSVANKMQGLRFLLITVHRCTCVNVVHTFLAQSPYVIGRVLPSRASVARTECCVGGGADPFWDTVVAAEPASRGFRGGTTNVLALRVVKGMTSIELQVSYITPLQLH